MLLLDAAISVLLYTLEEVKINKTLTAKELCQRWNISDNTLRSKENAGIIHPLETGGKKKIYSMKDIKNVEASGFIKGVC